MPITIIQANVRNWVKNKYAFSIEKSKYNSDIVLLNETALPVSHHIKFRGYQVIKKSQGILVLLSL